MSKSAITPDGIPANCGYIDMNSINEIYYKEEGHEGYSYLDVYTDSVEDAEELLKTIKNLPSMKGKTFTYQVNSEDFDLIAKPLSSLNNMINTAVTVITVVGAMIIVLLLVLWTRSRKKEIGILLALGKSKGEIIGQFLIENWLIGIFSVIASAGLAIVLADKVGSFIINKSGESVYDLTVRIVANGYGCCIWYWFCSSQLSSYGCFLHGYSIKAKRYSYKKWTKEGSKMSILSFSNLKYSYNDKQGVLKGISGQLELGKNLCDSRSVRLWQDNIAFFARRIRFPYQWADLV